MNVLLSIKPEYAARIFAGEKLYEFRRRLPSKRPIKVVVYVTAPVMKIIGEFEVDDVIADTPRRLWEKTRKSAGISFELFERYFSGCEKASAFCIGEVVEYSHPIEPREALVDFRAPQSFRYIR